MQGPDGSPHRTWRFCHIRTDNGGYPTPPAETPGHAQLSDIPLLPHRLLAELPFRVMQALEAAGARPLPPREAHRSSSSSG